MKLKVQYIGYVFVAIGAILVHDAFTLASFLCGIIGTVIVFFPDTEDFYERKRGAL